MALSPPARGGGSLDRHRRPRAPGPSSSLRSWCFLLRRPGCVVPVRFAHAADAAAPERWSVSGVVQHV